MIESKHFSTDFKANNKLGFLASFLATTIGCIGHVSARLGAMFGRCLVLLCLFLVASVATPSLAQGLPSASITVSPAALAEDDPANFLVTVSLSATQVSATTVNLGFAGPATAGTDYTG